MKASPDAVRPRYRCANDASPELEKTSELGDDSEDVLFDVGFPAVLRRTDALCCGALWLVSTLAAAYVLRLNRTEVGGHMPPFLIPAGGAPRMATATLLALLLMPWALVAWRQLRPQPCRWAWPDAAAIAIVWFASSVGAACLVSAREQPSSMFLVIGTTIFGVVCLSMVVLTLVRAAVALVAALATPRIWRWEPATARTALLLVAVVALYSGFRPAAVQTLWLQVSGLPGDADGYSLCMVSDLHAGPTTGEDRVQEIVARLRGLECRAIVLNGDIAEGTVSERAEEMQEFATLVPSTPDGVYFVPGNHEFYNFAARGGARAAAAEWTSWWSSKGVRSLNNSQVLLPRGKADGWFVLAGVDDPLGYPDLGAALRPAAPQAGSPLPVVLAAHRPSPHAADASRRGVAVQLSGHTHGGQLWPIHLPASVASDGYLSGLYQVNDMQLYVSDGSVGTYMTRLRLLTQSEITQVFLTSKTVQGPPWRQARLGVPLVVVAGVLAGTSAVVTLVLYMRKRGPLDCWSSRSSELEP